MWKDKLRQASFRGIPFHVQESGNELAGRRVAVHEYPGRDVPYVEDLGARKKAFTIKGYLLGDDCIEQRDRLVAACNEAGPGTLEHPTLGSRSVLCTKCSIGERTTEGRMCRLSLGFEDAGTNTYPTTAPDTQAQVQEKAAMFEDQAGDVFMGEYDLSGLPSWALESVQEVMGGLFAYVGQVQEVFELVELVEQGAGSEQVRRSIAEFTKFLNIAGAFKLADGRVAKPSDNIEKLPGTRIDMQTTKIITTIADYTRRMATARVAGKMADIDFISRGQALEKLWWQVRPILPHVLPGKLKKTQSWQMPRL